MLDKVITLLGFKSATIDADLKTKLEIIIAITSDRLKILVGSRRIPRGLEYVVVEVAIKRFNRISSEGLSSHSLEGETLTWASDSDFDEYMDEIELASSGHGRNKAGVVRFI